MPAARSASTSLDLDGLGAPAAPPARTPSTSLDLDAPPPARPRPAAAAPAAPPPPGQRAAPGGRVRLASRLGPGTRQVLTPAAPTVTLTRLQSGIGTVTVELAVGTSGVRLGGMYELADGTQSTVQQSQGERTAPPGARRPVIVAGRDRFEELGVDARRCRDLRRLIVYALPPAGASPAWTGTVILRTYGGARLEVPLDGLQAGDVAALLSIYQMRGEFVVRAEMQTLLGRVRELARAYGFEGITWLDPDTPLR